MLVWGSGNKAEDLGCVEHKHCETCNAERPFHRFLQYSYGHLWYIFKWVKKKEYMKVCNVCHHGETLDAKQTEAELGKSPIPFMTRYGWAVLLGLFALLMVFGSFSAKQKEDDTNKFLAAPQVNDIYMADLNQVLPGAEKDHLYGTLKVLKVEGEQISLAVSKGGYTRTKGINKDISSGKANAADYYSEIVLSKTRAELQAMHSAGILQDAHR